MPKSKILKAARGGRTLKHKKKSHKKGLLKLSNKKGLPCGPHGTGDRP